MSPYAKARILIDEAHEADPNRTADGVSAELRYSERVEAWVKRLCPEASELLCLAANCQHLERWKTPRQTYPAGRAGYLEWRRLLYTKQACRAEELLLQAGVPAGEAAEAALWISKTDLKTNEGTQALEDAAILVFLENEIEAFLAAHEDKPREKMVEILRKSWRKLTPRGQAAAAGLKLTPAITSLIQEAVA